MGFKEISYLRVFFFYNLNRKFQISWRSDKNYVILREDRCTFFITSRSVLLKMRNVLDNSCREILNTHIMFKSFFFPKNRAFMRFCGKCRGDRSQMTIRRMPIASWIPKATNTHCGPSSSVGITTEYGLDGPGSNPSGNEIFLPSGPAPGLNQPPLQWVPGLSLG